MTLQVFLGVNKGLSHETSSLITLLDKPINIFLN